VLHKDSFIDNDEDFFHHLEENHWWFVGRRRIVFELIQYYIPRPARVLDAGCGTGYTARELARFGEVSAFDTAPQAVAYAAARRLAVKQGEVTAIPYADGEFDLVTALDVLEHVEDDRQALAELLRVLKPGGILILTVPAYQFLWSPHDEVNHHKRRYTAGELRRKTQEAGFHVLKLSYYNTALFIPIALARLFRRLFPAGREEDRSDFSLVNRGMVNTLLTRVLSAEAYPLRYIGLPFGVSLVGVAKKLDNEPEDMV
jgi:SAM-dependent methyltransferase